jgi:filamentous hemagglutinin family protein
MYTLPLHAATSVVANNALPNFDKVMSGALEQNPVISNNGLTMDITQTTHNAVIKWNSFDVGGSATVNFWGPDNHNTLNYVNSANMSQIYGTINANNNGNIFIVNPAGVQIGNSAQINVGSLYVSNSKLTDDALKAVDANNINFDFNAYMKNNGAHTDAALMSLGNINANKVTFEGDGRIVIDSERITNDANNATFRVNTNDAGNVLIGYDAYEETFNGTQANSYKGKDKIFSNVYENGSDTATDVKGYMWVEDVEQLQAIDTNLSGNYALRNSIDATATENWNDNNGFSSIGVDENGKTNGVGFTGNFDGIDYNIFGLTINRSDETNVGLFGAATNANINNVTLVGGKIIGGTDVGAIVGAAEMTNISNVTNSAKVEGNNSVGGIVGVADATTVENAINTGAVEAKGNDIGGLIGSMTDTNITDNKKSELIGNSYNLGDVSSEGHNVGGLVGHAVNSTIGDGTNLVYNRLDVEGAYNVGGIVGNMEGSTVQNAENSGTVEATGYTTEDYTYHTANTNFDNAYGENGDGIGGVKVNVANVGGIVGTSSASDGKASQIKNVTNTANVSSNTGTYNQYGTQNEYYTYTAGNVGGIVGRAENTYITNATNQENEIRGAHNVGGVAGYFGGSGTVSGGINDGGDIMATGARAADGVTGDVVNDAGFAREHVRTSTTGSETFIIGNMGGVVGYMDGDNVYVTGSANRGTVHSQDINNPNQVLDISQAANTGGVVGKIDRNKINDEDGNILTNEDILAGIKDGSIKAAVTDSYNTGDVRGYTGVGGVIGMMYNGEVADSYNLGNINTTRQPVNLSNRDSVNMGGVVGDTTEGSGASAVIYNVYNKGQIGDENYETYARHVGGIVGRLSGIVDKSYNTGAIYNGYSVVGGIAGWFYEGTISNSFNTGNITVYNKETYKSGSQVGGIAGGMSAYSNSGTNAIYNAYNLGTLRSFNTDNTGNLNSIGGIVGKIESGVSGANTDVEIKNVYTTSNIYSSSGSGAASIYADSTNVGNRLKVEGANYIDLENNSFTNLDDNGAHKVSYSDRYNSTAYKFVELSRNEKIWADVKGASVSDDGYWRIYNNGDGTGTTPILNAFLPDSEKYFSTNGLKDKNGNFDGSVQYGTAYDPLLTIVNTNKDLIFYFGTNNNQLSISNAAGIAVYGGGLTFENFNTSEGTGYFGGTIYADGSLKLDGGTNDIGIGSASQIYGSDVAINTDGKITIYGDVTATGNEKDNDTTGGIDINAGDVDVYGTLTSAKDEEPTKVSGVAQGAVANFDFGDITDKDKAVTDIGNRFAVDVNSSVTGDITINAGTKVVTGDDGKSETVSIGDGNVNLYYGNKQEGLITTGGDLTVTGTGDVYVDSDLDIGGNLTLNGTGADSEVVLDITNIGQVQADNGTVKDALTGLHNFMHHFSDTDGNTITIRAENSGDAKLAVDMWNYGTGAFDLNKYDDTESNGHTLLQELQNLNISASVLGNDGKVTTSYDAQDSTYIWVSTAEQLQGIQDYYNAHKNDSDGTGALTYNYALKNDINASDLTDYEAIGTGATDGFTGTFDGRGNRIIGLDATQTKNGNDNQVLTNAGIFSTVGDGGTVKNLNVYSGTFTGSSTAGAIAGINNGTIENITAFGNTVTVTSDSGNAGGIAGTNSGTVDDVESTGSVIAEGDNAIVGGLVGTNESGATVNNSYSNSAVTSTSGTDDGLGGVVGVNEGTVSLVDSLGVTNGINSTNVGGVIGINSGTLSSAYNESIVNGYSNVGGIIGENSTGGTVTNIVNATGVTGENESADNVSQYVGGLVGSNSGSVTNGRNNGTITGTNYVGGMVGSNAQGATLTNLVNDSSAEILGVTYVGGIAGSNSGTITAEEDNDNLVNRGSITGHTYVGGVAGVNTSTGKIANTNNSVVLNANEDVAGTAEYFGGVVGQNSGLIDGATNTSDIDITAVGGSYVGGIIGQNTASGRLEGKILNQGSVAGKSNVGGIIGLNENEKVLQGAASNRLTVTNEGNVTAEDGGAAGIFYANTGNISYADITNTGTVTGGSEPDSVTGGLFGTNSGEITNSTLTNTGIVTSGGTVGGLIGNNSGSATDSTFTNSGTVSGNTNVGGLFGTNSGKFETSSLINTVNAQVIGTQNVGGLIGTNTGIIIGGRNEAQETDEDRNVTAEKDSYYKYQVYNNGTITVTGSGSNIGGLSGENATGGSLTAGYNTGAINAENSSNVGGIAGSNAGTIDQVFNTVMTENGQNQTIAGGTNVGGLVGTNSGTLSNAYNTTDVFGNSVFGNAVGNNTAKGTIKNIYASNNSGKLIGKNINQSADAIQKAYSFVNGDTSATKIISGEDQKDSGSYAGFDFANGTWKNYDENGNPLLKVFLTDVTINVDVDKINKYINNVYNGDAQYITDEDIDKLIAEGAITAPDNFTAYKNAKELINSISHTNAGTYNDWLYSGQIAETTGNTFNPNNLGYDIKLSASIAQAELSIKDIFANIVYGGSTYTDIKGGSLEGIINNDEVYLLDKNGNKIAITSDLIAAYLSEYYAAKKDNRNTADVKRDQNNNNNIVAYEDAISVDGISLGGTASGNYKLTDITISGDITVTPATLNITLNDIYRIYGDHKTIYSNYDATQTGDYGIKDVIGLVNGDQDNLKNLIVKAISDGALDDYANPTKTNDVTKDGYKWTGEFSGIDNVNSNYTITVDGGNSIVKAKTITIKDLLASIVYGNQDNKGLQINTGASLADGSIVYGDDVRLVTDNAQYTTGGAYEDSRGNRTTADVGEYTDSLFVSGLSLTGDKAENYVLDKTAAVGDIEVTKANLIINVGNAETVYGDAFNDNDYTHTLSGVTNGDSDTVIDGLLGGNYDNTVSVEAGKDTANAGTYKDALGFVNYQQLKNYDVQVENGDVIINKKQITIGANNEQIFVGETPNYSGTDINGVLVNGDSLNGNYHYGVADGTVESVTGTHTGVIGIWIGGVFYDLSQNVDWTQAGSFFSNYEVNSTPGTLTVSAYDIPEDWPHNRWDYLFNDAPFDRNKDFRERKAEVNFVDGGMEI